jgi:hypothetical protein
MTFANAYLTILLSPQQWHIRAGTAISVLVRILLSACISIALCQRIWRTLRCKALRLATIDRLFSTTSDPTAFFDAQLLREAKLATCLSLLVWCVHWLNNRHQNPR